MFSAAGTLLKSKTGGQYYMKSKYLMIGAAVLPPFSFFSGVMLWRQYADEKQSAEAFDNIAALVEAETPSADEPQESEPPQPEQTAFEKIRCGV